MDSEIQSHLISNNSQIMSPLMASSEHGQFYPLGLFQDKNNPSHGGHNGLRPERKWTPGFFARFPLFGCLALSGVLVCEFNHKMGGFFFSSSNLLFVQVP